jgi:predicted phage baseplate assembly protein
VLSGQASTGQELHIPAYWLRCRVLPPRPRNAYSESPRVTGVQVESLGGTVFASHAYPVDGEILGTSDGSPGQVFQLQTLPLLPRSVGERLEVEGDDGEFEPWREVPDFGASSPDDPHFVVDDVSGTVELGPTIRSPQGRDRQYGRVPVAGRKLRFSRYRSGGGWIGNVGAGTLTVLKSSIPYVEWVTNFNPATGGLDPEDIEHAKWRGPRVLRVLDRAVTAEDYETLACRASPAVARAHCVVTGGGGDSSTGPGVVRLLLVPAIPHTDRPPTMEQLAIPEEARRAILAFLDERRLLTAELVLEKPAYRWVSVRARLRVRRSASKDRVVQDARLSLYRYLHPLAGGPEGLGWPLGRELFIADIYAVLHAVQGVDAVQEVELQEANPETGELGAPLQVITPQESGLLCSAEHEIAAA